jgi:Family of unknown function (DUF6228)
MDNKYKASSNLENIEKFQRIAVDISRQILKGEIGIIAGCIQMNMIGHELFYRPAIDKDFLIFVVVASETDHLPTNDTCKYWDKIILKEKQIEINNIENNYRDDVFKACRSIVNRWCIIMSSMTIKSAHGVREIAFSDFDGDYIGIEIRDDTLRVRKKVYLYTDGPSLCDFFQDMASQWRGWEGKKEIESVEGDFRLEARSDGKGHIELRTTIRNNYPEDKWFVSIPIWLEAGSLEDISKRINKYIFSGNK